MSDDGSVSFEGDHQPIVFVIETIFCKQSLKCFINVSMDAQSSKLLSFITEWRQVLLESHCLKKVFKKREAVVLAIYSIIINPKNADLCAIGLGFDFTVTSLISNV